MDIYEVVMKLVGPVRPLGETQADEQRFANLKVLVNLADLLLNSISVIALDKSSHEFSVKRSGEFADKFMRSIDVPAADPAAPSAPRRQYYYKDSACKAASPDDPQCICWHDEGTGVYAGEHGEGVVAWRAVVSAPAAPDALSRSHELLRQAREALEWENTGDEMTVSAIAAITAYLPKETT